ncbi:MAG: phosphatidate cytidylyltransferase [Ruminococcaceae bacterium]|nr:phosphatidate cytidylyltransferase [Oscillospiraceae bacterium]
MKTRIIVAAIGLPLIIAVVLLAPAFVLGIMFAIISALCAWEFMKAISPDTPKRYYIYPVISAALIPLAQGSIFAGIYFFRALVFVTVLLLTVELIFSVRSKHGKIPLSALAFAITCGLVFPYMLSSIVRLKLSDLGWPLAFLPFIIAFSSDAGGYFFGMAFGKHKLAPHLSKNKTIEGGAGGIISAAAFMLIYYFVLKAAGYTASIPILILYGITGSVICQLGDICFSAVKREGQIKDFGTLIPGHGGMLDRFDSMHFTAAFIEIMVFLLPAIWVK